MTNGIDGRAVDGHVVDDVVDRGRLKATSVGRRDDVVVAVFPVLFVMSDVSDHIILSIFQPRGRPPGPPLSPAAGFFPAVGFASGG
jgi:hypothetical protein